MEIKGKVIYVDQIETGTSKAGKDWEKTGFAIKFKDGEYEKEAYFTLFNKSNQLPNTGDYVNVKFNIGSRQHNGRWYSELSAWKVEQLDTQRAVTENNDLPF